MDDRRALKITDPLQGLTSEVDDIVYRNNIAYAAKRVFEASTGRLVVEFLAPMDNATVSVLATIQAVEKADLAMLASDTQRVDLDRSGGRWWITTYIRSEQTAFDWVKCSHMGFDHRNEAQCQLRRMVRAKLKLAKAA